MTYSDSFRALDAGESALTRRGFLKTAGATSGGLVIAMYLPGCGPGERAPVGPAKLVTANAWLRIGTDSSIVVLCDRSEMGQGVYTALPTLIAEELNVDPAKVKVEFAPAGAEYVNTLLGTQATGGSTSVRDAWDKLRMAGAEARERLKAAAAQQWRAPVSSCSVLDGYVMFTNRRKSFGELAEAAAALPRPEKIEVKPRSEFRYVGKPQRRLDAAAKVDGSARFGIDVRLPGMLYAALAQSPVLGGAVKSFKADRAQAMPGVRSILQTSAGVAVIADSWWQARQARDALEIEWAPGRNASLSNASIGAGLKAASGRRGKEVRNDGDAAAALRSSGRRVEATYELPLLAHATLEPQNCTVEFREDGCHVYVPTQAQQRVQATAAKAAGLPVEQVFVHTTFLGGGFGRRLEADFVAPAVECAKAAGKPVKLLWTREDDTMHDLFRPPARNTLAGAFDAQGRLNAVRIHLVAPSITARWAPAVVANTVDPFAIEAAHNFPYEAPNVYVDYLQHEIGVDVGYWRSVSHALNCFAVESFMDELAAEAQIDPYLFRRGLLNHEPRWQGVLDAAARKAQWDRPVEGRYRGVALMSGYDSYLAQVAEISVRGDELKVHRIVCAVDCGQVVNPGIVQAQVEGSIIFGLTAALWGEINIENGRVKERNFNDYRLMRINEAPQIEVYLLDSTEKPGGMGEPAVALVAPALCNAIYAATRRRIRSLPLARQFKV